MSAIVWIYFRRGIAERERERGRKDTGGRDSRMRSHPSSCYITQQIHSAILLMLHVRGTFFGTDVAFPVCVSDSPAAYYDPPPKTRGACARDNTYECNFLSQRRRRLHPRRRRRAGTLTSGTRLRGDDEDNERDSAALLLAGEAAKRTGSPARVYARPDSSRGSVNT